MSAFLTTFIENKRFLDFDTILPCSRHNDNLSGILFKKGPGKDNSVYFDFTLNQFTTFKYDIKPYTKFVINPARELLNSRDVYQSVKENPHLSLKVLVCQDEKMYCFFYDGRSGICFLFKLFREAKVTSSGINLGLLDADRDINPNFTMLYGV